MSYGVIVTHVTYGHDVIQCHSYVTHSHDVIQCHSYVTHGLDVIKGTGLLE